MRKKEDVDALRKQFKITNGSCWLCIITDEIIKLDWIAWNGYIQYHFLAIDGKQDGIMHISNLIKSDMYKRFDGEKQALAYAEDKDKQLI